LAQQMGIRSQVSSNYAMILGAMKVGVTPLDMAHAYETFATGGRRVYDPTLGAPDEGPTGIAQIVCPKVCPQTNLLDRPSYVRVLPAGIAKTVHDILTTVVQSGTGTQAAIPGVDVAGKTGTTSNYGDAWFVGWTPQLTVAVWVGFPDSLKPMATDYNGQPVEGGTYPAIIWRDFVGQALQILANEQQNAGSTTAATDTTGSASTNAPASATTGTSTGPATATTGGGSTSQGGSSSGGGATHTRGGGSGTAGSGPGGAGNSGSGSGNGGSGSGSANGNSHSGSGGSGSGSGSGGAGIGAPAQPKK
jgi:penicillin-binding protein 1A